MGLCKRIFHLGKSLRPKQLWVITISQFHDPSISPCCQFLMGAQTKINNKLKSATASKLATMTAMKMTMDCHRSAATARHRGGDEDAGGDSDGGGTDKNQQSTKISNGIGIDDNDSDEDDDGIEGNGSSGNGVGSAAAA